MSQVNALTIGVPVDLTALNRNFPTLPLPEVPRDHLVRTLTNLVQQDLYAAYVEGPEGMGKTTLLTQLARANPSHTISLFFSAANRLSYDPDLLKEDLTMQVHWAVTGDILDRNSYDPGLLKSLYADLQRIGKYKKTIFYFVIDGAEELPPSPREALLQQISDILPIGIPQFRFFFSGDQDLYKKLIDYRLPTKPFIVPEFGTEETRQLFTNHPLTVESAAELNSLCRGIPGRLSAVLRALDKDISISDFLMDGGHKLPEIFEIDWRQVDPNDDMLRKILALLAYDLTPHTAADAASILGTTEGEVRDQLDKVNFVVVEANSELRFASIGLTRYAADRLKDKKQQVQKLLIKRLMAVPRDPNALLQLPQYLEEAAQYQDLVNLLTPDHIQQVLERSQTLGRVDDAVKRGFRSAQKLGRDADILRFGIQQCVISDLAAADLWEHEVAALAALNRDAEALALANSAILKEDRLQMLSALAQNIWLRGDTVPAEMLAQIELLIGNLDFRSLGRRAIGVATKLTCVSPDLATTLLKKAEIGGDGDLDRTAARVTVSALRDLKDDRQRDAVLATALRSRQDPAAKALLEGVRLLAGRLSPSEVCERSKEIREPEARLQVLRYWCLLNAGLFGAEEVAMLALSNAVATSAATINASLLADISSALIGVGTSEGKKSLIGALDGLRATAERLGPSVDYVRLQLAIATAEADVDTAASEGRLLELLDYIDGISDLPSKGESLAQLLGALRVLKSRLAVVGLERQCIIELESVVLVLSESTADHYVALGGIITGLVGGDLDKALDYVKIVNTERRRDAILSDAVDALLRLPVSQINVAGLRKVLDAIVNVEQREDAMVRVVDRFADVTLADEQLQQLLPLFEALPLISDSVLACRGLVRILHTLQHASGNHSSLRESTVQALRRRWEHIDVAWIRVETGFGIARDLAQIDVNDADGMLAATEQLKEEVRIASPRQASTYIGCVRLVIRLFCGLLPRHLETEADVHALAALIDAMPTDGERAVHWADICMRAAKAGRQDFAEQIAAHHLQPTFGRVHLDDASYRTKVLIQIAPALYRTQPTTCLEELEKLSTDDQDVALLEIIRFLVSGRIPSDPSDRGASATEGITYEVLRQVEALMGKLNTDWMIYSASEDVAEALESAKSRYTITKPQREDIGRRIGDIANQKLPTSRHISHPGFKIITLAQAFRISQVKSPQWADLIEAANKLDNVADRVFVLQVVALCLPKNMAAQREVLLNSAHSQISHIPWQYDQVERYLGMAEDLHGVDTALCRQLIKRAAEELRGVGTSVKEQRRKLVDIAYRVEEDFANKLIDAFDDDEAKHKARDQVRLLEVRKAITESEGRPDEDKILQRVRSGEVSRLGTMLAKALFAGRIQSYRPGDIREYLELAAGQRLRTAYPLLIWYVENAIVRFSRTDQASTLLRPMFDGCVIGAQLAAQIAGRALVRLKALRSHSTEISAIRSLLVTPGSRDEAMGVVGAWCEKNLGDEVLVNDPYFSPSDLPWLQVIRTANPDSKITVLTARKHQPTLPHGSDFEEAYSTEWRLLYDQEPPKTEIAIIGGAQSRDSPIHDRWLVTPGCGLRFGTSLNSLGISKDSEISEMNLDDTQDKCVEIKQYLLREKTEHKGEKLLLTVFWL